MDKLRNVAAVALLGVVALYVGYMIGNENKTIQLGAAPGPTETNQKAFLAGFTVGSESTTVLDEYNCATKSWNPGSLASSSVDGISSTSTDVTLTGAALGDVCVAGLTSSTSTSALINCAITGAASSTVTLWNTGTDALDLATGTITACYFD